MKPVNAKPHNHSSKYIASGYRYLADGWTDKIDLFCFWADRASYALEEAKELRVKGSHDNFSRDGSGFARHGCEDVVSVHSA